MQLNRRLDRALAGEQALIKLLVDYDIKVDEYCRDGTIRYRKPRSKGSRIVVFGALAAAINYMAKETGKDPQEVLSEVFALFVEASKSLIQRKKFVQEIVSGRDGAFADYLNLDFTDYVNENHEERDSKNTE